MIDIGEKAVNLALRLGANEAEAFLMRNEGTSFSIEKNSISFSSHSQEFGIGIRVLKAKKLGFAYCSDVTELERAAKEALASSRLSKVSNYTFPASQSFARADAIYDEKIEALTPSDGLDMVKTMIDAVSAVDKNILLSRGSVSYGTHEFAIVNSQGVEVSDKGTSIGGSASTVLKDTSPTTGFSVAVSRTLDVDFGAIGHEAAELALNTRNPRKCASKRMDALLTPYALSSLLEFVIIPALYGDAAHKGESVYSDKLNELVTDERLAFVEDGRLPGGLNTSAMDDEGVASRRVELVKHGVLNTYLYDSNTAMEHGAASTGNAVRCVRWSASRSFKATPSIKSRNFIVEGERAKLDDIIADTKEGVLVYDIMGAHTSNPASGDFSVNASILFKIEKGEIRHPLRSVMLSGNLPELLRQVTGIGDDVKMLPGSLSPVSLLISTLGCKDVRVTR